MTPVTFEQGWAARPFKEQFPILSDDAANRLDDINRSITSLRLAGMLTDSQADAIRQKKFPKMVGGELRKAINARDIKRAEVTP